MLSSATHLLVLGVYCTNMRDCFCFSSYTKGYLNVKLQFNNRTKVSNIKIQISMVITAQSGMCQLSPHTFEAWFFFFFCCIDVSLPAPKASFPLFHLKNIISSDLNWIRSEKWPDWGWVEIGNDKGSKDERSNKLVLGRMGRNISSWVAIYPILLGPITRNTCGL